METGERTLEPTTASKPRGHAAGAFAAARLALGMALLAPCFACSFIKPEVGKFRGSCKGSGGEYARPDAYSGGSDPRCASTETDDACQVCEDANCCATRFGCYDDDSCACADQEFDECLDGITDPTTEEGTAATAHCWEAFSANDARAKARVDCQRNFCKEACAVP